MKNVMLFTCLVSSSMLHADDDSVIARLGEMEGITRSINGDNEKIKHRIKEVEKTSSSNKDEISTLKKEVEELKQALKELAEKQAHEKNAEQPKNIEKTGKKIVQKAIELLNEAKYVQVIDLLSDFLANENKDLYRGQAYYYLGIAYKGKGQFKNAATAFLTAQKENSDGIKAPDALKLAADCMKKLKQNKKANVILDKLKTTYPDSKAK